MTSGAVTVGKQTQPIYLNQRYASQHCNQVNMSAVSTSVRTWGNDRL